MESHRQLNTIDADLPVLIDATSVMTHSEAKSLARLWRPGEQLWTGHLPYDSFCFQDDGSIWQCIFNYFINECYLESHTNISDDDISVTNYWLEILPKMLWLAKEWHRDRTFREPVMAHWNPRIQKNVIHPGMTRSSVIRMFPFRCKQIPVIYFNTGGGLTDQFASMLEPAGITDLFKTKWNTQTFVFDHGSIIPHFSKDLPITANFKKVFHKKVIKRLRDFRIFTNTKSLVFNDPLEKWIVRDPSKANVSVVFVDAEPSRLTQAAALVCALLNMNYKDDKVEVTCS